MHPHGIADVTSARIGCHGLWHATHEKVGAVEIHRLIVELVGTSIEVCLAYALKHEGMPCRPHKLVEGHGMQHHGVDLAHWQGVVPLVDRDAKQAPRRDDGMRKVRLLEVLERS